MRLSLFVFIRIHLIPNTSKLDAAPRISFNSSQYSAVDG